MAGKRSGKSLSSGRPPNVTKPKASLSSQATRTLIRSHHQLNKKLETAKSKGNDAEVEELQKQIEALDDLLGDELLDNLDDEDAELMAADAPRERTA